MSSPRMKGRGFSLVELMIAMVIGLLLIAGIGQILLSGQRSFKTQSGTGALQENGRFALYFLQRDIRMAGFPRSSGPTNAEAIAGFLVGANATRDGDADGANPAERSDQIAVQFNPDGEIAELSQDCLGQTSTAPVINRYFIARIDNSGNAGGYDYALMCQGSGNAAAQQIILGVESFQVLYGEDTDGDSYANVYRNATNVTNWDNVTAVRIGILLNTREPVADIPDLQSYAVLDAPPLTAVDLPDTAIDERLFRRRVFTTTIEIRNRTHGIP